MNRQDFLTAIRNGKTNEIEINEVKDVLKKRGNVKAIMRTILENNISPDMIKIGKESIPLLSLASEYGNKELVKKLLYAGANPDATNIFGDSALIVAISANQPQIVKCLLEHHADPNLAEVDGTAPLIFAVRQSHTQCAKLLLEDPRIDINHREQESGENALLAALDFIEHSRKKTGKKIFRKKKEVSLVKSLLKHPKYDSSIRDKEGHDALWYCIRKKWIEKGVVQKVIEQKNQTEDGCENQMQWLGETALFLSEHPEEFTYLCKSYNDFCTRTQMQTKDKMMYIDKINHWLGGERNRRMSTSLINGTKSSSIELSEKLESILTNDCAKWQRHLSKNKKSRQESEKILNAYLSQYEDAMKEGLKIDSLEEIDFNHKLIILIGMECPEIANMLLQGNEKKEEYFLDLVIIKARMEGITDIDKSLRRDELGLEALLTHAISLNPFSYDIKDKILASLLIYAGADPNKRLQDPRSAAALANSGEANNKRFAFLFENHIIDPDDCDSDSDDSDDSDDLPYPLSIAAAHDDELLTDQLIKAGADMNAMDYCLKADERLGADNTPLMNALLAGSYRVAKRLLRERDIEVNHKATYVVEGLATVKTTLMLAVESKYLDIVESLLAHKDIDMNAKDENGHTALGRCLAMTINKVKKGEPIEKVQIDIIEALIKKTRNTSETTEMLDSVCKTHTDIHGEFTTPEGLSITPLMLAIRMRSYDLVDIILKSGVDVNKKSKSGDTAFTTAVGYFDAESSECKKIYERLLANTGIRVNDNFDQIKRDQLADLERLSMFGSDPNMVERSLSNRKIAIEMTIKNVAREDIDKLAESLIDLALELELEAKLRGLWNENAKKVVNLIYECIDSIPDMSLERLCQILESKDAKKARELIDHKGRAYERRLKKLLADQEQYGYQYTHIDDKGDLQVLLPLAAIHREVVTDNTCKLSRELKKATMIKDEDSLEHFSTNIEKELVKFQDFAEDNIEKLKALRKFSKSEDIKTIDKEIMKLIRAKKEAMAYSKSPLFKEMQKKLRKRLNTLEIGMLPPEIKKVLEKSNIFAMHLSPVKSMQDIYMVSTNPVCSFDREKFRKEDGTHVRTGKTSVFRDETLARLKQTEIMKVASMAEKIEQGLKENKKPVTHEMLEKSGLALKDLNEDVKRLFFKLKVELERNLPRSFKKEDIDKELERMMYFAKLELIQDEEDIVSYLFAKRPGEVGREMLTKDLIWQTIESDKEREMIGDVVNTLFDEIEQTVLHDYLEDLEEEDIGYKSVLTKIKDIAEEEIKEEGFLSTEGFASKITHVLRNEVLFFSRPEEEIEKVKEGIKDIVKMKNEEIKRILASEMPYFCKIQFDPSKEKKETTKGDNLYTVGYANDTSIEENLPMLQFCIAIMNIECYAKGITSKDFGQVLEKKMLKYNICENAQDILREGEGAYVEECALIEKLGIKDEMVKKCLLILRSAIKACESWTEEELGEIYTEIIRIAGEYEEGKKPLKEIECYFTQEAISGYEGAENRIKPANQILAQMIGSLSSDFLEKLEKNKSEEELRVELIDDIAKALSNGEQVERAIVNKLNSEKHRALLGMQRSLTEQEVEALIKEFKNQYLITKEYGEQPEKDEFLILKDEQSKDYENVWHTFGGNVVCSFSKVICLDEGVKLLGEDVATEGDKYPEKMNEDLKMHEKKANEYRLLRKSELEKCTHGMPLLVKNNPDLWKYVLDSSQYKDKRLAESLKKNSSFLIKKFAEFGISSYDSVKRVCTLMGEGIDTGDKMVIASSIKDPKRMRHRLERGWREDPEEIINKVLKREQKELQKKRGLGGKNPGKTGL